MLNIMYSSLRRNTISLLVKFFQVIKHITGGGADYSFECIGDTGMITTALQSCCDVIFLMSYVSCFLI